MDIRRLGVMGAALLITAGNVNGQGSAEAILRGLEKAASGQTEEQAANTIAEHGASGGQEHVARSFICRKAGLVRQITIEYPAPETGYVCRVLYDSEKGFKTPWYAKNDRDYCAPRAAGLVNKHLEMGWECDEQ